MTQRNWTLLFNITQRIELFFEYWLKELNFCWGLIIELIFSVRLKELNFLNMTERIPFFFSKKKTDSKNWILFFSKKIRLKELNQIFSKYHSKNWTLFYQRTQRIAPFFSKKKLKELNSLFNMSHIIEPLFNLTHRIEPFFWTWVIEIEPFFSSWIIEIELFSKKIDF